ncbi:DUF2087 domain-containing protein [Paeniglutamicibacter cryotolerans]|uniref:DUF2087 domain-containing protein n=1 Tax=Paeniglutamicibacter cryotolerans TaxID=670079 RepID=A0A839QLM0_9MICC|nr:DUF2087 domain-containing protein [Paeniglutamicibacter cryotolerans]MBB2995495.1 hypothetical protein [Paeniglutamicibacter cryotolerans]
MPEQGHDIDWRRVLGALSNAGTRTLFAELVLGKPLAQTGAGMKPAKRAAAIKGLESALLLIPGPQGPVLDPAAFRRALASGAPKERAVGVQRFLIGSRIKRYPASQAERFELLDWVVQRALNDPEQLNEAQVNERLSAFTGDIALLRRYLVDHGLLERTADGSTYRRAPRRA